MNKHFHRCHTLLKNDDIKYVKVIDFGSEKEYVDALNSYCLQPPRADCVVPRVRCFGGARRTLITATRTPLTGGKRIHTLGIGRIGSLFAIG